MRLSTSGIYISQEQTANKLVQAREQDRFGGVQDPKKADLLHRPKSGLLNLTSLTLLQNPISDPFGG